MKLIATASLLLSFSLHASAQTPAAQPVGIHTAGVDHVGITVPDLKQAQAFLASTFGCTPVTHIGPFNMTTSLSPDRSSQVAARAASVSISMVRCGTGSNIELFEYARSTGNQHVPNAEDLGASHIAFYTDDVQAGVAYLKSKGITVLGEPMTMPSGDTEGETWVHFLTPWGSEMELVGYPHGKGYEKAMKLRLWSPKHPAA
jgi:catechol 2,3-dioxygenase-like lactoylglutathione lyase family enzyme